MGTREFLAGRQTAYPQVGPSPLSCLTVDQSFSINHPERSQNVGLLLVGIFAEVSYGDLHCHSKKGAEKMFGALVGN